MSTNEQTESSTPTAVAAVPIATATGGPATGLRRQLQNLCAGLQGLLADGAQIGSVNSPVSKAQIVSEVTAGLAEFAAVDSALIALTQARQTLQDDLPKLKALRNKLELMLKLELGESNPLLAHYGLKPQQPRKALTPEKLVARTAKAAQTRVIRGTKGKKQKAALQFKGQVVVHATVGTPSAAGTATTAPVAGSSTLTGRAPGT